MPALENACQVLCNLAASLDGALPLLKSSFLSEACKSMRACLQTRETVRTRPIILVIAALAAHGEGQKQLLRNTAAPNLLELVLYLLSEGECSGARTAAVLLIRNLSFRLDNKVYFLADPRCVSTGHYRSTVVNSINRHSGGHGVTR
jgi:hypothetical protein